MFRRFPRRSDLALGPSLGAEQLRPVHHKANYSELASFARTTITAPSGGRDV